MGLFKRNKNNNKPIITQILDLVPRWLFVSCAKLYQSGKGCSKYETYVLNFRTAKGGVKLHTARDDTLMIPKVVYSKAKVHDRYRLEQLIFTKRHCNCGE